MRRVLEGRAKLSGMVVIENDVMAVQSLKRLEDPRDVAALTVFLASDAAESISGAMLSIGNDMQRS